MPRRCGAITAAALSDVRGSRGGRYADVMVDRIRELKLERGRIGLLEIDPRHKDYLPVNQYNVLRERPARGRARVHARLDARAALDPQRRGARLHPPAGKLCEDAMNAMVARARPGVTEYQLRAAAGAAILEGGGDIDFLIIGSTAMDNPALVFGNPRPSGRVLQQGDIINMELAAGYRGYTAQIGSPICIGPPTDMVKRFWDEITLPGFEKMAAEIKPGNPLEAIREAGKFFRQQGVQSRPIHAHGIDLITDGPHVFCEHVDAEPFEQVFKPGMVFMAEPNPITADGQFGIFLGHTFIVTETGNECVDKFPVGAGGRGLRTGFSNTREPDQREADQPEHDERRRDARSRCAGRPSRRCGYRPRARAPPSRWW